MRYTFFDTVHQSTKSLAAVVTDLDVLSSKCNPLGDASIWRLRSAIRQTYVRFLQHYPKQGWEYDDIEVDGKRCAVEDKVVLEKPFCNLIRFRRQGLPDDAPKLFFVAALSGHHATLSRDTFLEFMSDHEVYVSDWLDGRHIPVSEGRFGLEEYIAYVIEFMQFIGANTHVVAICQAGPAALVAAAVMSKNNDSCLPDTLTFMASPMDMRVNPGWVSRASKFMNVNLWSLAGIHKVPERYAGAGRMVYPGVLQLGNFMSMNFRSHLESHVEFARSVYKGDNEAAQKHRDFYDEYFAVLDMPAEFCIETMERIFINNEVPANTFTYQGQLVDFGVITDIPVLAMEGGDDNMVRIGQCTAVTDICENLPDKLKEKYIQQGVGHYGIFNGSIFRAEVAPMVKDFMRLHTKAV